MCTLHQGHKPAILLTKHGPITRSGTSLKACSSAFERFLRRQNAIRHDFRFLRRSTEHRQRSHTHYRFRAELITRKRTAYDAPSSYVATVLRCCANINLRA